MSENNHSLRNGIFGTVIGGIILMLVEPMRTFLFSLIKTIASWLWYIIKAIPVYITTKHEISGWLMIIFSVTLLYSIYRIIKAVISKLENDPIKGFISANIDGIIWRWSWNRDNIVNLWCFCPVCDNELVYDDEYDTRFKPETYFSCEKCGKIIGCISGGDRRYALEYIKREIRRRIRTNEYLKN